MAKEQGRFLTFEGNEGAGKTTLIQALEQRLSERGIPILRTREPGGVALAEKVRSWVLEENMKEETEALLYLAARAEHVARVIKPALLRGTWVLCDRYTDSTLAYQGYGRGIDLATLQTLNTFATKGLVPDITFLLVVEPELGLRRAKEIHRFEKEALAFHEKVRDGFLTLARQEPQRFELLDTNNMNPLETLESTMIRLEQRFSLGPS
jgi:dTMP kinase